MTPMRGCAMLQPARFAMQVGSIAFGSLRIGKAVRGAGRTPIGGRLVVSAV
jgi:hypothetical protein